MMALGLAESALNAGRQVAVYLDVNAPELAKRDKSGKPFTPGRRTVSAKGMGASVDSQKMLTALMAKGAKVYVCPMCMKNLKTTPESLLDGITVLSDKEFLDLASDATVHSY
jgi:predicted peroxiredoxin